MIAATFVFLFLNIRFYFEGVPVEKPKKPLEPEEPGQCALIDCAAGKYCKERNGIAECKYRHDFKNLSPQIK